MTDVEHYTQITTEEYAHMANVILSLREQKQRARQLLESKCYEEALEVLKQESE